MTEYLSPIESLATNYGKLHILELGAIVGILIARLWRNHRAVSLALLGICTLFVGAQLLSLPLGIIRKVGFRIASYPAHFLVPMYLMTGIMCALDRIGMYLVREKLSADVEGVFAIADEPSDTDR